MNPILSLAALLYLLFMSFYGLWGFFVLYHLFRFAPRRDVAVAGTTVFLGVTAFLLLVTAAFVSQIQWSGPFLPTVVNGPEL